MALVAAAIGIIGLLVFLTPRNLATSLAKFGDAASFGEIKKQGDRKLLQKAGAPLIWISFDEDALAAHSHGPSRPNIPHVELARLLALSVKSPDNAPLMVFADVNILGDQSQWSQKDLRNLLYRWRENPKAPVLALLAGNACLGQGGRGGDFDPEAFTGLPQQSAEQLAGRIYWSCPAGAGDRQMAWSCVSWKGELHALPSPAWLAEHTSRLQAGKPPVLGQRLRYATRACRGGSAPQTESAPIAVPEGYDDGLSMTGADGRRVITPLLASDLAGAVQTPASFAGALVIIGGNPFIPDRQFVEGHVYPGSMLLGMTLRTVYLHGISPAPSRSAEFLAAVFVVLLLYGSSLVLGVAKRALGKSGRAALWAFLTVREGLPVIVAIILPFFIGHWFPAAYLFPMVLGIVIAQLMITSERIWREWDEL